MIGLANSFLFPLGVFPGRSGKIEGLSGQRIRGIAILAIAGGVQRETMTTAIARNIGNAAAAKITDQSG